MSVISTSWKDYFARQGPCPAAFSHVSQRHFGYLGGLSLGTLFLFNVVVDFILIGFDRVVVIIHGVIGRWWLENADLGYEGVKSGDCLLMWVL